MTTILQAINPDKISVILDLRYFSKNNICQQKLYDKNYNFLHPEALIKLEKAVNYAQKMNLKIKIFDAYRPLKVQKFMYDFFASNPELQKFFSNPETGSVPHCRGVAVDLTLCDMENNELDMGSDFDELSDLAHHNSPKINPTQLNNRNTLLGIMTYAGFDFYNQEWWHYQLFEPRKYPII